MKYLIVSDIHGSQAAAERIVALHAAHTPDFLLILGDILYHGPRNPLPGGHNPQKAAALLNTVKDNIIAVRGNCEAEVDQIMLDFPCMNDYALITDGGRRFFLTHGHLYAEGHFPFTLAAGSVALSGHTHIWRLDEKDGIIYCNPGSVSLPKGPSPIPSYALYDNGSLGVYTLESGAALAEVRLPDAAA